MCLSISERERDTVYDNDNYERKQTLPCILYISFIFFSRFSVVFIRLLMCIFPLYSVMIVELNDLFRLFSSCFVGRGISRLLFQAESGLAKRRTNFSSILLKIYICEIVRH